MRFQLAYAADTPGAAPVLWTLPQLHDASSSTLPLPVPSCAQLAARGGGPTPIEVTVLLPVPFALPARVFEAAPADGEDGAPFFSRNKPAGVVTFLTRESAVTALAQQEVLGIADPEGAAAVEGAQQPGRALAAAPVLAAAAAAAAGAAAASGSGSGSDAAGGRGSKRARTRER